MIHAFTVIRWPLELGHNFAYFVAALCEAALFTQAGNPPRWYPVGLVMVLLFWMMFFYERRMYRVRRLDCAGPAGAALLDVLEAEHEMNIRLFMPALVALWGGELPIQRCTVHKHRNLLAHAPSLLGWTRRPAISWCLSTSSQPARRNPL